MSTIILALVKSTTYSILVGYNQDKQYMSILVPVPTSAYTYTYYKRTWTRMRKVGLTNDDLVTKLF